jgi:oxygen-independent coproporphyrinogen-3 oxidase
LIPAYIRALIFEINSFAEAYQSRFDGPDTIYFGGGTPTLVGMENLYKVTEELLNGFGAENVVEFTVEVNPGTVNLTFFRNLKKLGVNRISLGVQSFNDAILKSLGRIHTAKDARAAITAAQKAGFENISLDLMYGLPGQTMIDWQKTLVEATSLGVKHISAYGLQVEEGTDFYKLLTGGKLNLPDDETEAAMYELMCSYLPLRGYARYEISNFAKPSSLCLHNFGYWTNKQYLGMGASGASFIENFRWSNVADVKQYIELLEHERLPAKFEHRTIKIAMSEFCFLALRTTRGIERAEFFRVFGREIDEIYSACMAELIDDGLLEDDSEWLRLTALGFKYANRAFVSFLL